MKLILYSGGYLESNLLLDRAFIKLLDKKNPLVTFIPSCFYGAEFYYREFIDHYKSFKIKKFIFFPVDVEYSDVLLEAVFKSDVIHLSGGNTFYFLKYLREKKLLTRLRRFVKDGGILTGLSAGAILMSPTIHTAGFPSFDRDENDEKLKNLKSLNLVSFDFFPHYKNSARYDKELKRATLRSVFPLYGVPDGSGIVIEGDSLHFMGRMYYFFKGKKTKIA